MKLQGVSVIFALIVLPLILVLIYYIQLQVDTIDAQNRYDVKLLNSTYGAMSAFEINTANEDLSSVSDSLRTIIDASTNIFFNTLSTNLGMSNASKSYVEPYIPALLYTLYDGYYISAPTRTPKILTDTDGNAVTMGSVGVTVSGSTINYKEVHTSDESQANCTNCIITRDPDTGRVTACQPGSENHIIYNSGDAPDQPVEYSKMTAEEQCDYYVEHKDLTTEEEKQSYGQLIYIKKKADPNEPDSYTIDVNDAELEVKHVLKTYMPYSARYKDTNFDVTVVYTLDNYVTVEGTLGDIYYTKSGYFIPEDSVNILKTETQKLKDDGTVETITKTGTDAKALLSYNQNEAKDFIYDGNYVEIELEDGTNISTGSTRKSYAVLEEEIRGLETNMDLALSYIAQFPSMQESDKTKIETDFVNKLLSPESVAKFGSFDLSGAATLYEKLLLIKEQITQKINDCQYKMDEMSSVTYYVTAQIFSNWIYENFVNGLYKIEERHLVEISGQEYNLIKGQANVNHDFSESSGLIFNIVGTKNIDVSNLNSPMEIDTDSTFYTHKLNVIRDSIQYNLNLAMSTYNKMLISTQDYAMPVMQNEEWEKILNNVSIVSFMQGYNCGLKTYSNYKIVSSTNNEISVSPREIYYVEKTDFSNENTEYHRIDCPKLLDIDSGTTNSYIAFLSKEVKYDKIYDKANTQLPYKYDHKNFACYECINDGNYDNVELFDTSDGTMYSNCANLRKAYHIGVGKARNNLYKMNAVENSQGYEVVYDGAVVKSTSTYGLDKIKSIEVVLDTIKTRDSEENVLNYTVKVGSESVNSTIFTIVPNVTTKNTLKIDVDQNINVNNKVGITSLNFTNIFENSTAYSDKPETEAIADFNQKSAEIVRDSIEFIRVIYR